MPAWRQGICRSRWTATVARALLDRDEERETRGTNNEKRMLRRLRVPRWRRSTAFVVVSAFVLAFPLPGPAAMSSDQDLVAGIKEGLKTAAIHSSELIQPGGMEAAVKLHLQHTINCLEGPAGLHFRPAAGDPCQGNGHGIIPDLQSAAAKGIPGAEKALADATVAWSLAIKALAMTDVNEAQPWALVAAKYLKMASADLGG